MDAFVTGDSGFVGERLLKSLVDRSVPWRLARWGATAGEAAWRALPLPGSPPLSRMSVATVGQAMTFDDGKARRELGYERRVSRAAGLVELRRTDGVGCGSTGDQPRAAIVSNAVGFSQSSWSVPAARKRVGAATHSVVTEAVGAGASASNHHAT